MSVFGPVWECPTPIDGPGGSLPPHTLHKHILNADQERAMRVPGQALIHVGCAHSC